MIITFFEIDEREKALFTKKFPHHTVNFYTGICTIETAQQVRNTEILSTCIYSKLTKEVLSQFPNLTLIATRSTGIDHIDLDFCKSKGITVYNVPAYGVNTIAEHTFALMLALSRKLIPSVDRTRRGDFTLKGLQGFELAGKTLGIIGFGHIGSRVAAIAKAFTMNVLVYTRHPDTRQTKKSGVTFVDLPTLLTQSDIVSIHVPLTGETTHLINTNNVALMKKGSMLINTARGGVVETEAILRALAQGILAGAGLDVLEEECMLKEERALLTNEFLQTCNLKTQLLNHVLLTKENVVITPHNAFNSKEALMEIPMSTVENITTWIQKNS